MLPNTKSIYYEVSCACVVPRTRYKWEFVITGDSSVNSYLYIRRYNSVDKSCIINKCHVPFYRTNFEHRYTKHSSVWNAHNPSKYRSQVGYSKIWRGELGWILNGVFLKAIQVSNSFVNKQVFDLLIDVLYCFPPRVACAVIRGNSSYTSD